MQSVTFKTTSEEQSRSLAKDFAKKYCDIDIAERNLLIGFDGELAAGKTLFISEIIKSFFKPKDRQKAIITSPTFTYVNYYQAGLKKILHADFYRLANPNFTKDLAIEDALQDHLCLIEWPNKGFLQTPYDMIMEIEMTKQNHNHRNFKLNILNPKLVGKY